MCFYFFMPNDYNTTGVLATIIAGLLVNLFFAHIEYTQLHADGFVNYISSPLNWIDIIGFTVYIAFSITVLVNEFGKQKVNQDFLDTLKFLMCFSILLKTNFFLRVNSKMGLLVTLIKVCFIDVIYFTIYLCIWMVSMTIAYKVLGMSATGYE